MERVIAIVIAYLLGSFSSAIVTCRLLGLPDPRTHGSGNPGASNVLRIGGKKAAIFTLLGDVLKGFIPVLVARLLGLDHLTVALVMLAAVLGHLYPIFFRFQGGKGVATLIGDLLALNVYAGIAFLVVWVVMAAIFRFASLASITAMILSPLFVWYFTGVPVYYFMVMGIGLLLIFRHRSNLRNLAMGTETKLFAK
jgi:glycerol-3-phosphate acyltransferase PlsY